MTKRINLLTIGIAIYVMAILLYALKSEQNVDWAFYHYSVTTYAFCLIFVGMLKRNKTELDKALLIGIVLIKLFNWLCYLLWYLHGCSWQNQPYIFCIIVAVCMFLGIIINKKLSWK